MNTTLRRFSRIVLAAALVAPALAFAEANVVTTATGNATARLDFKVTVPRILFLSVGTSNSPALTANTTVDLVHFDYTNNAADVGGGITAPASVITVKGVAGNSVPVKVVGNNGQVNIAATGSGTGLSNGVAGDPLIAWSEITATSDQAANLPVPAVGANANALLNTGSKVTNRTANWSYAFKNSNALPPGAYTGTVTYTASMP